MEQCQKVKFGKKQVKTILNYIRYNQSKRWRKEVRYYQCANCNYWHLTSWEEFSEPIDIKIDYERWEQLLSNQES